MTGDMSSYFAPGWLPNWTTISADRSGVVVQGAPRGDNPESSGAIWRSTLRANTESAQDGRSW
jgi:hypothetical protein